MKRQTKMIASIKKSLKDESKLKTFNDVIEMAFGLTQKKRFYIIIAFGDIKFVCNIVRLILKNI